MAGYEDISQRRIRYRNAPEMKEDRFSAVLFLYLKSMSTSRSKSLSAVPTPFLNFFQNFFSAGFYARPGVDESPVFMMYAFYI